MVYQKVGGKAKNFLETREATRGGLGQQVAN
jgi:hypothetical protein